MESSNPPPGGSGDGLEAAVPGNQAVPSDAGKAGNGTATGQADDTPNRSPRSLRDELLSEGDDQPQDDGSKPEDPPPPSDDQKPAGDDQNGDQPEDQRDESQDPEREPADRKDFGRKRIRNLEKSVKEKDGEITKIRESVTTLTAERDQAIKAIDRIAELTDGASVDETVELVGLTGRALIKQDPAAIAELRQRLGIQDEAPSGLSADDPDIRVLIERCKDYGIPTDKVLAKLTPKSAAPAQTPPKPKPQTPPKQPEAPPKPPSLDQDPRFVAGRTELKTLSDEIRAQHGDHAEEILTEIATAMQAEDKQLRDRTGSGLLLEVWGKSWRQHRDAVLARRNEQSRRTPPQGRRPSHRGVPAGSLKAELLEE